MILDTSDLWDSAPLAALLAYQSGPKQAWDNTELAAPWLFKELAYGEAPMAPELKNSAMIALRSRGQNDEFRIRKF
jgi:hypothetical protein